MDIERFKRIANRYSWGFMKMDTEFTLVVPATMCLDTLHNEKAHVSISINSWDAKHVAALPHITLDKATKGTTTIELSINSFTVTNFELLTTITDQINRIVDTVQGKRNVMLNYVKLEEDRTKMDSVYRIFVRLLLQLHRVPTSISPCLRVAGEHIVKPCHTYNILDYIDNNLKSAGCPWPHKPCEDLV
jgi:hypothetical protein